MTRPASLSRSVATPKALKDTLGICQWFHYEDYHEVTRAVELCHELGITHLRTGISWADYHRPHGPQWYDWMLRALTDFEVLLSVWHTPPSISEGDCCASPPRRLQDFADFIDTIAGQFRPYFAALELWNEPNNRLKWDFIRFDPDWRKFGTMITMAASWTQQLGISNVLGGMIPVDHHWLRLMHQYGALQFIDHVGIHAFPGMWWPDAPNWDWHRDWNGWPHKIHSLRDHTCGKPIWVTETGLATWDLAKRCENHLHTQTEMLAAAAAAPAERIYWYSLVDLDPRRPAIEGFHVDENEYHLGLVKFDGRRKPAFYHMQALMHSPLPNSTW